MFARVGRHLKSQEVSTVTLKTPLETHLFLAACPHCQRANPTLQQQAVCIGAGASTEAAKAWVTYICSSCGNATLVGVVLGLTGAQVSHFKTQGIPLLQTLPQVRIFGLWPELRTVSDDLPPSARRYLGQALRSLSSPDGAVMLAGSAVDAMLKEKGLCDGSLYHRINVARDSSLITSDMAMWAHEVRLSANGVRHADAPTPHPTEEDARRAVEFATALGDIMFSLPARVTRGRGGRGQREEVAEQAAAALLNRSPQTGGSPA